MFLRLFICIYTLNICICGDIYPCIQPVLHICIYICSVRPYNTTSKPLVLQEAAVSMA